MAEQIGFYQEIEKKIKDDGCGLEDGDELEVEESEVEEEEWDE